MKKDLHPTDYRLVVFQDSSCDYSFITKSTIKTTETIKWTDGKEYPLYKLEISNKSHPFFTGKQNLVDTAGRIEKFITHEYSIGDFVVTSGEIPAMIFIDSIVRLIPGVINNLQSALSDSFAEDLLDSPFYTQPREINGLTVPKVLLSGNHKEINLWRKDSRLKRTKKKRPDLMEKLKKINRSKK